MKASAVRTFATRVLATCGVPGAFAIFACTGLTACSSSEHAQATASDAARSFDAAQRSSDAALGSGDAGDDTAHLAEDSASDAHTDQDARTLSDAAVPGTPEVPFDCPADHFGLTRVDVGELKLQVACQGTGPVVLMLHGYPELHLTWNKLAAPLVARGFRVIAPDQRGYNVSDKPSAIDAYGIDHLVADVHRLIELSGEKRVLLVAHDWGGVVAWVFTHRHPQMVRGLVAMNAPHPDIWGHPELDATQAQASDGYVPLIAGPLGALAIPYVDSLLSQHLSSDELVQYRAAWNQPDAISSMNKWYQANVSPSYVLPEGNTISVPTLALWGTDDTFVTPSQLDYLPMFVADLDRSLRRRRPLDHASGH